jgi:hypothetical protein
MKKANTKTTTTFVKRGKMVFCMRTYQLFPSAKAAAEELGVGYHTVAKTCEGKMSNKRGLFYVESIADINELFTAQNAKAKERAKAEAEYELLKAKLAEAEKYAAELRQQTQKIEKMIS